MLYWRRISLPGNIWWYWIFLLYWARYITFKITYIITLYWRLYCNNITFNMTYNITLYRRLYYIAGAFTAYFGPVTLSCGHSQLPGTRRMLFPRMSPCVSCHSRFQYRVWGVAGCCESVRAYQGPINRSARSGWSWKTDLNQITPENSHFRGIHTNPWCC